MPLKDPVAYNAYMREYMLKRYHRRRKAMIEALGGKCARCGSKEKLEFDHKDRKTKKYDVASILAAAPEARVKAELKKCQLLCEVCHLEKSKKDISAAYRERQQLR